MMLSKLSLAASALGIVVAGTGAEVVTPVHVTQSNIAAAYKFDSQEACHAKLYELMAENPTLRGKLQCKSND